MKATKMLTILALGLIVWPAPMAHGAQYLTVNGKNVNSITVKVGQSYDVEVRSDSNESYEAYVGFDDCNTLGSFSDPQIMWQAGDGAEVNEVNTPNFCGYRINAKGVYQPPSSGLQLVLRYVPQEVGRTTLRLYDFMDTLVDSVQIEAETEEATIPLTTGFTYQGRLKQKSGLPVIPGQYDFQFELYDRESGGKKVGGPETREAVNVDKEGCFTVKDLDFGREVFNKGNDRWLEIRVNGEKLTPRQRLAPTPYAIHSRGLTIPNDQTDNRDEYKKDRPILVRQYRSLGNRVNYNTHIDTECWTCGIFGFRTEGGNIKQSGDDDIFWLYLYAQDENGYDLDTWWLKANFKDDGDSESWFVNIICFHNDLVIWQNAFPKTLGSD